MTKVKIALKGEEISSVTIQDHAGFANHGQDIVCAGISSIAFGALNAFDEQFGQAVNLSAKNGVIQIQVLYSTVSLQACLQMLLWQLKTIESEYPNHIKITKKEV